MKAKIEYKGKIEKRTPLQDVIPLKTPFLIFIEPTDKCNFRCKFCPTGDVDLIKNTANRNYGNMKFDLYKKIIDDISDFDDKIKMIQLYKDGEPLLNPNFPKMVEYAKKSGCIDMIATTTNASLLNEELSLQILEAGLDRIHISIEGINEKQYHNMANVNINFDKLVKNIEFFYKNKKQCHVYIKTFANNLSENDKNDFYHIFGDISDSIFIENIIPICSSIDSYKDGILNNNVTGIGDSNIKYKNICPNVFYSFAINSDGSVSPCCADWSRIFSIGNVNSEKIVDLWNGKNMRNLQKMFLMGNRKKHHFCSSCGLPTYGSIDDIDNYADELLNKIMLLEQ